MTLATSTEGHNLDDKPVSTGTGEIFSSPVIPAKQDAILESPDMIAVGYQLPALKYELRRRLPMKQCAFCQRENFSQDDSGKSRRPMPRKTSWIYREVGWFMWYRVCWYHMTVGMKQVVKEMYSR